MEININWFFHRAASPHCAIIHHHLKRDFRATKSLTKFPRGSSMYPKRKVPLILVRFNMVVKATPSGFRPLKRAARNWFSSMVKTKQYEEERTQCSFPGCFKTFSTRFSFINDSGHMVRHLKIHTGEKIHNCLVPGCTRSFARKDNMMHHYRSHQRKLQKSAMFGNSSGSEQSISPEMKSERPLMRIDTSYSHLDTCLPSPNSYSVPSPNDVFYGDSMSTLNVSWNLHNVLDSNLQKDFVNFGDSTTTQLDYYFENMNALVYKNVELPTSASDFPYKNSTINIDSFPLLSSQYEGFSNTLEENETNPWRFVNSGVSSTFAYTH